MGYLSESDYGGATRNEVNGSRDYWDAGQYLLILDLRMLGRRGTHQNQDAYHRVV